MMEKGIHDDTLRSLLEMCESPHYRPRKEVIASAADIIVQQQQELVEWKAKAEANERIKKFVGKLLIDFMPEFGDIDGCYFQDEAFNHGLLKCVDSPSDDDRCSGCDGDCDYCYRLSPLGQEACDAARSAEKEK